MTKSLLPILFILAIPFTAGATAARLDDFATPFVKCSDSSNRVLVKVYDYFEGVAGIQVAGLDYLTDARLKYTGIPLATVNLVETAGQVETYRMSFKNIWDIGIKLGTAATYKTTLTHSGTRLTLSCVYARRQ